MGNAIKWDGNVAAHRRCLLCVFECKDGWHYVAVSQGRHASDGAYITDESAKSAAEAVVHGWTNKEVSDG